MNKDINEQMPSGGVGNPDRSSDGVLENRLVFCTNNAHKLSEIQAILGDKIKILSLKDIGCDVDIPETGKTLEENALIKARYVYDHYHMDCFADDTGLEVEALDGAPGVYSARYAAVRDEAVRDVATESQQTKPAASDPSLPPSGEAGNKSQGGSGSQAGNTSQAGGGSQAGNTSQVGSGSQAGGGSHSLSHDSEANMTQLLKDLGEKNNRKARFRTVIALIQKKNVCPCGCTSIRQEHLFEGIVEGEITKERSGAEGFGYDPIFRPDGYDKTFAELGGKIKNQISHRARATQKLCEFLGKE